MSNSNPKIKIEAAGLMQAIAEGQNLSFGRSGGGANIEFEDNSGSISRKHFSIRNKQGQLFIVDLNSTNGIIVNGNRIDANTEYPISSIDSIQVAKYKLEIELANTESKGPIYKRSEKGGISSDGFDSDNSLRLLELFNAGGSIRVGTSNKCDVRLDSSDPAVAPEHALFTFKGGIWHVEDLGSIAGTFVDNEAIEEATVLEDNSDVYIGCYHFNTSKGFRDLRNNPSLLFKSVGLATENEAASIVNLNLSMPSGQVSTIFGSSTSNSHLLLDMAAANIGPNSGKIKIYGLDLHENYEYLKTRMGILRTDSLLDSHSTVAQSLNFYASIKLGPYGFDSVRQLKEIENALRANFSKDEIKAIWELKVGDLSNGMQKRLELSIELLSKPCLLLLQKPFDNIEIEERSVFSKNLKNLVASGIDLIISSDDLNDTSFSENLVLLGEGSTVAYIGKPESLSSYLKGASLESIITSVKGRKSAAKFAAGMNISIERNESDLSPSKILRNSGPLISQFGQILSKEFRGLFSANSKMLFSFGLALGLGVFFALVFGSYQTAVILCLVFAALSLSGFNFLNSFKEDHSFLSRYKTGYLNPIAYFGAKVIAITFFSFSQVLIIYGVLVLRFTFFKTVGFEAIGPNSILFSALTLLLICSAGAALGALIAQISVGEKHKTRILGLILIPQLLLTGLITKLDSIFAQILSYLSLGRWGTEAMSRLQDQGSPKGKDMDEIHSVTVQIPSLSDYTAIDENGNTIVDKKLGASDEITEFSGSALQELGIYATNLGEQGTLMIQATNSALINNLIIAGFSLLLFGLAFFIFNRKEYH